MEQVWTEEHELLMNMIVAKENICDAWKLAIGAICKDRNHTRQMIDYLKTHPDATENECVDMAYKISGRPRHKAKS